MYAPVVVWVLCVRLLLPSPLDGRHTMAVSAPVTMSEVRFITPCSHVGHYMTVPLGASSALCCVSIPRNGTLNVGWCYIPQWPVVSWVQLPLPGSLDWKHSMAVKMLLYRRVAHCALLPWWPYCCRPTPRVFGTWFSRCA